MMECRVPVGYACKFDNVLSGDQTLLLGLGVAAIICVTIVIVGVLILLDERDKRKR